MMAANSIEVDRYEHPAIRITWGASIVLTILHILLVLLPMFATGMHAMRAGEIWGAHIDLTWHPYYATGDWTLRGSIALLTFLFVTTPLCYVGVLNTIWESSEWSLRTKLFRSSIFVIYAISIVSTILYWGSITAWIFD